MARPAQKKPQPSVRRKADSPRQPTGQRKKKALGSSAKTEQAPKTGPAGEASPSTANEEDRHAHRWTFLTNHTHVLVLIKAQPELILREVARQVGITERAVQRIIQDLEAAGFILRHKVGRQNHYEVLTERPLRHPIEAHRTIGDLLRLING